MNIDLAAFRLNALTTLTGSGASAAGGSAGNTDFLNILLQARGASGTLNAGGGSGSAVDALLGGESSRMNSVLSQLEASNAAFLQRYNARVEEIGDEAEVLTQLRERVAELGAASGAMAQLKTDSADDEIRAVLREFIAGYNAWDAEFDPYFERGGLLEDNQAGGVARFSLRREVGSIFHGAGNGGFELGLTDMGVRFTADGQLVLDEAAFDAALASDREGALGTLNNVARAFGQAAEMLSADGHLLDRRIDNAERAVAWAADNQDEVDAEFGPGAVRARLRGLYG
ncbi:hypothetical protein E6C76_17175 [Pseudothauera nasutitermitis]|uniref:Flagellar hook-associated protein 2 C-terminal domain-containing protein n=1 Tax=Pseudothauera nasutitermitis TaxID=2565930 RepID=A0A4S4AUS0_9RHOO|nr:hypothetical protein [Pseudothauera nasutitermitis]THF62991.1 hypothetical protein E6C76_17175 [Pseudothauera nasutitermitis]